MWVCLVDYITLLLILIIYYYYDKQFRLPNK